jgi:glutathione synthase/RimK-type ligase-like ATP-grasp enzyme
MRVFIKPYAKSNSAFKLARALGIQRLMPCATKFRMDMLVENYRYQEGDIIINWGCSGGNLNIPNSCLINSPAAVRLAVNKLSTFRRLFDTGVEIVNSSVNPEQARRWAEQGFKVFCRQRAEGRAGQGIVVAYSPGEVVPAKLYTKGEIIKREYRVHIIGGELIDLTAKALRRGGQASEVQNRYNGYVYARDTIQIPDGVREGLIDLGIRAVSSLGLIFGAVDILRNTNDELKVLEVNSAPGIMGIALEKYSKGFKKLLTGGD